MRVVPRDALGNRIRRGNVLIGLRGHNLIVVLAVIDRHKLVLWKCIEGSQVGRRFASRFGNFRCYEVLR